MSMHRPVHADAKTTLETEMLALRRRLARAHRILTAGGIWPITKGHVSARIPGTDHVLILGHIHSEGRSLIDTDVDDIVTVDIDGKWLEGRIEPVDERYLHLEIMKARPDVTSVVHAHPTYATAFGIAGTNILPVGNRGAIFAPEVAILDYDRQIDTPEPGGCVVTPSATAWRWCLKTTALRSSVIRSKTPLIATFSLEETAQLHWIAAQLGPVQKISTGEVRSVLTGARKEEFYSHVWGHYARLDPWYAGPAEERSNQRAALKPLPPQR